MRLQNYQGLTAFDFIRDYDEWIDSGCFIDDHLSRLKGMNQSLIIRWHFEGIFRYATDLFSEHCKFDVRDKDA